MVLLIYTKCLLAQEAWRFAISFPPPARCSIMPIAPSMSLIYKWDMESDMLNVCSFSIASLGTSFCCGDFGDGDSIEMLFRWPFAGLLICVWAGAWRIHGWRLIKVFSFAVIEPTLLLFYRSYPFLLTRID